MRFLPPSQLNRWTNPSGHWSPSGATLEVHSRATRIPPESIARTPCLLNETVAVGGWYPSAAAPSRHVSRGCLNSGRTEYQPRLRVGPETWGSAPTRPVGDVQLPKDSLRRRGRSVAKARGRQVSCVDTRRPWQEGSDSHRPGGRKEGMPMEPLLKAKSQLGIPTEAIEEAKRAMTRRAQR